MTTTIDYKLILTGVFLTCLILYFAGTGTMTKPLPRVVGKTTNIQIIYRGIPLGHPGYESAKDGIARPVGGNSTPWMHRDGQQTAFIRLGQPILVLPISMQQEAYMGLVME